MKQKPKLGDRMPWRNPNAPAWPPVRNPFEIGAGMFYVAIGFFGVLGAVTPSMSNILSPSVLTVWLVGAGLSGAALVASAAVVQKDYTTSMLLERVGLTGVLLFSAFLLGLFVVNESLNVVALALLGTYIYASGWRLKQVHKWVVWAQSAEKVVIVPLPVLEAAAEEIRDV